MGANSEGDRNPGLPEEIAVRVDAGVYFLVIDHEGNLGGSYLLETALDP